MDSEQQTGKPDRNSELLDGWGRRLKAARIIARFETPSDMAAELGIEPARYRKYERGESMAPPDILEKIAVRLGVSLDYLILGYERKWPQGEPSIFSDRMK